MLVLKCLPAVLMDAISSFRLVSVFSFASRSCVSRTFCSLVYVKCVTRTKNPTRMMPSVRVTKMRVKKEIWKLKIFFSEWGMSMTVNRCFPLTMMYLKKFPSEIQMRRNQEAILSANSFSAFLYSVTGNASSSSRSWSQSDSIRKTKEGYHRGHFLSNGGQPRSPGSLWRTA